MICEIIHPDAEVIPLSLITTARLRIVFLHANTYIDDARYSKQKQTGEVTQNIQVVSSDWPVYIIISVHNTQ